MRKKYNVPCTKVKAFTTSKFMIPISGETTPEEADAKRGFVEDEGQDKPGYNVWNW